jgi:hypothetical protein
MYIARAQIGNYKSFRETQPLEFFPGFNIVSGQNNAGKTSLLEALGLNVPGNPHRSIRTLPARDTVPDQVSWVNISFVLSGSELRELVLSGLRTFLLVKPAVDSAFARRIGFVDDSEQSARRLMAAIFAEERLVFPLRKAFPRSGTTSWDVDAVPSFGLYPPQGQTTFNYFTITLDHSGNVIAFTNQSTTGLSDIGVPLGDFLQRHVYRFLAERMKVGPRAHGPNRNLLPDASNLSEVLNILWVEGRTEEKCFPLIVERMLGRSLRGTEILGIRQAGDLESRDAKKVFEIYRNLTSGSSLLPPAIAFVLDQECRSENAKRELRTLSGNRAIFLRRRMFENYLLNPTAIAHVANAIEGFRSPPLTADEVTGAVEQKLNNTSYICSPANVRDSAERLRVIDGARILKEIFAEFSETRVPYEKVRHGIALTEWLIENAPADLQEVRDLLAQALDGVNPIAVAETG